MSAQRGAPQIMGSEVSGVPYQGAEIKARPNIKTMRKILGSWNQTKIMKHASLFMFIYTHFGQALYDLLCHHSLGRLKDPGSHSLDVDMTFRISATSNLPADFSWSHPQPASCMAPTIRKFRKTETFTAGTLLGCDMHAVSQARAEHGFKQPLVGVNGKS